MAHGFGPSFDKLATIAVEANEKLFSFGNCENLHIIEGCGPLRQGLNQVMFQQACACCGSNHV